MEEERKREEKELNLRIEKTKEAMGSVQPLVKAKAQTPQEAPLLSAKLPEVAGSSKRSRNGQAFFPKSVTAGSLYQSLQSIQEEDQGYAQG